MAIARARVTLLLGVATLAACGGAADDGATTSAPPDFSRAVTAERLANAAAEPNNWLTHGGTYLEQRHSPLTQIDKGSLRRLAPAWY